MQLDAISGSITESEEKECRSYYTGEFDSGTDSKLKSTETNRCTVLEIMLQDVGAYEMGSATWLIQHVSVCPA